MKKLELQIWVLSAKDRMYESLNLPHSEEPEGEWKKGFILLDKIIGFFEDVDDTTTIRFVDGTAVNVKMNYKELNKYIV